MHTVEENYQVMCNLQKVVCIPMQMVSLPWECIEPYKPAFSHVSLDIFGPVIVKKFQNELKRYGCILICLVTRAIHIEKMKSRNIFVSKCVAKFHGKTWFPRNHVFWQWFKSPWWLQWVESSSRVVMWQNPELRSQEWHRLAFHTAKLAPHGRCVGASGRRY